MKLLFAIKRLEDAAGGAERVLSLVTKTLVARGHQVSVLSFDRAESTPFYPLDPAIRRICLPVGDCARPATARQTLRRLGPLRAAVRRENPDVVIGFMHSMFVPLALALIGTNYPLVASEHIVPAHYKTRRLEFALLTLAATLARSVTVVSNQVRDLYPSFLRRRMTVVPNPVDSGLFKPAAPEASRTILSAGRLDLQKDQRILIEAFAALADRYPDWSLRIVGEGPLRPDLERQISIAGLGKRISLPGLVREMDREYAAAGLFVMPSVYESFGLTVAEAMGAGLPVVGFADCPGTNTLVDDGRTGLLVPVRSAPAMAEAMERLVLAPEVRRSYGNNGRLKVETLNPQDVGAIWEKLLRTACKTACP